MNENSDKARQLANKIHRAVFGEMPDWSNQRLLRDEIERYGRMEGVPKLVAEIADVLIVHAERAVSDVTTIERGQWTITIAKVDAAPAAGG